MKEYMKPLVEVVEIETEDVITASAGNFSFTDANINGGKAVTVDYAADIFDERDL